MTKQKEHVYEFAMIGHPGAGKTTLAAGLFASVNRNFVTIPNGTTAYVNDAVATLKGQEWPPATTGVPTKLSFTVMRSGRNYQIRFDDFPGEKISEDSFIREVVKKEDGSYPDGVLLLVNCAAKQMDDAQSAADMEMDFRAFVAEMAQHKVPIALVITAWDRMETDRKDRRNEFERFLKPLTVILDQNKCRWNRFDVSVTGQLKDQQRPTLAPSHVEEPFVWLLNQQPAMIRRRRFSIFLIILAVLLALAGIYYCWTGLAARSDKDPGGIHHVDSKNGNEEPSPPPDPKPLENALKGI